MNAALALALLLAIGRPADRTEKPRPESSPGTWVTPEDYPAAALRAGIEGRVSMLLTIDPRGSVTDCAIAASSGSDLLDQTACGLFRLRGRFRPARNQHGREVVGQTTLSLSWKLPDDADEEEARRKGRTLPPFKPFSLIVEADVDADGVIGNCRIAWAAGMPPQVKQMCDMIDGTTIADMPGGNRADMLGKHLTFRVSMTIEPPQAAPPAATPRSTPPPR